MNSTRSERRVVVRSIAVAAGSAALQSVAEANGSVDIG